MLLELVAPVLRSIGTLWEQGELSIADEHRASVVAMRLISRLGARFGRRGHKRGTVVLAAPSGEQHSVPVAIAANLLRWRGFAVIELGANTPAEAVAEAAAGEPRPCRGRHGLHDTCVLPGGATNRRRLAASAGRDVPVLLGGAAITDQGPCAPARSRRVHDGRADELVNAVEAIVASKS